MSPPPIKPVLEFCSERLESRRMLAGSIVATLVTPTYLVLTGDSDDNALGVTISNDGDVAIVADAGTEIVWQRESVSLLQLDGVSTIDIRLRSGDDTINVRGATPDARVDSVQINARAGDDHVELADFTASRSVRVYGQSGNDSIRVLESEGLSPRSSVFFGGGGRDTIWMPSQSRSAGFEESYNYLELSPTDADANTLVIESFTLTGQKVAIPSGSWPVRPVSIQSNGGITGHGAGVSELRLKLSAPGRFDPQYVVGAALPSVAGGFVENISVNDLTLSGNFRFIDWSNVYGDGNAFGLFVRATKDSRFEDLEIRAVWTDGIYVSNILHEDNNSRDIVFEDITIHHAGRQGVSVVGGEQLLFDNFTVSSIGRDAPLHTSPRSAIDLEPEANVARLVRDITISNWDIDRVGQGILVSAGHSVAPATNIVIQNVTIDNLDGPQILAVRDAVDIQIENVSSRKHVTTAGLGVIFVDSTGTVDGLSIQASQGSNYVLRVRGESDITIRDLLIEDADRGVIQVGGEPHESLENSSLRLVDFEVRDVGIGGLSAIRIRSAGHVSFSEGIVEDTVESPFTFDLYTDIFCFQCNFTAGFLDLLNPNLDGELLEV